MAALDWVILLLLLGSLALGAWRGFVFEVISLSGWIVAFLLAQWLASGVAAWLPISSTSETLRYGVGFAVVFVSAIFAFGLVAALVRKMVEAVGLKPADRALGAVFGAARGVLLLLAATAGVQMAQLTSNEWWRESQGAGVLMQMLQAGRPLLPEKFEKLLSSS